MKLLSAEMKFEGLKTTVKITLEGKPDFEIDLRREYDNVDLRLISQDILAIETALSVALHDWECV